MHEDHFSFVTSALNEAFFQESITYNTFRIKSSVLKTVSLSRIARDNLVNNDDATIYNNDENRGIS